LVFEPTSLTENVVRGTQKLLDIKVTNIGDVSARDVTINLPSDPRISLVSFSNIGVWIPSDAGYSNGLVIHPKGKAGISLTITIESNAGLGEMSGSIAVNTNTTTFWISYKMFITSVRQMNLTFVIKDEYTYFASGSPLVTGAEVRLVNPQRGYSESRYSLNDTGMILFDILNVRWLEDQTEQIKRGDRVLKMCRRAAILPATSG
jgi:hypothetical protein